jgi:uncharacterized membrane protein
MSEQFPTQSDTAREQSGRDLATLVYLIQAISLFTAVPLFIGAIINYVKRGDVRGTMAESHFRWQIRTFWFSIFWLVVGGFSCILGVVLLVVGIGVLFIGLGYAIFGITWLWVAYRVIRGWLVLADNRPAY